MKFIAKVKTLTHLPELRKSIGWVTASLASEIPAHEKALNTVVSGKFAQIGYLGGMWGAGESIAILLARGDILKSLAASTLREQEFGTLSQGEQQKVLIARARMTKPYLIILDEPCAGMDPGAREKFLASLRKVGAQKKIPALIYVTHHIEEILPLFRHTLVLRDGKVLYAGRHSARAQARCVERSVRRLFHGHETERTLLAGRLRKSVQGSRFKRSKFGLWPANSIRTLNLELPISFNRIP